MPRPPPFFSMGSSEARGDTEAAPARKPPQDIAGLPAACQHPGRWRHGAQLSATTMSRLPSSQQAQTKRRDLAAEKALSGERGGAKARCQQAGDPRGGRGEGQGAHRLPTRGGRAFSQRGRLRLRGDQGAHRRPTPRGRAFSRPARPTVWAFVPWSGIGLGAE